MTYDSRMISKLFFRLLPVQIFLVAISSLNSIIDGTMASNLIGSNAMAVISLFAPILTLLATVNAVLTTGAQILCGQFLGRNQIERTKSVFSLDIAAVSVVSVLVMLVCLLFPGAVATGFGAKDALRVDFAQYARGMSFGLPPFMIATQLTSFLQLEQQERRTYIGIGIMMVSNLALDYLFVARLQMGIFGLGLATSVSYYLFAAYLSLYYVSGKATIRFDRRSMTFPQLWDMLRIGCPGAISQGCQVLRGLFLNYLMIRCIGNDALSAFAVINGTFGGLFFSTMTGVATATRLLVSVYSGEEDRTGLKLIIRTALCKGVPFVAAVSLCFVALSFPLTQIFYHDPASAVFSMTRMGFVIFPLCVPLSTIYLIFLNAHQCFDRTGLTAVLSVFDGILGVCIPAAILTPLIGMNGIWSSQLLNGIITTVIIVLYAVLRNRKMPSSLDELLVLPDSFGVGEEDRIDISIRSSLEVVQTSKRISAFCLEHGIDSRRSMFAALAMEEMAGNIVEHGFTKDRKKHSIDVRVVYKDNALLLRIKDDCVRFNPKEFHRIVEPDDLSRNVGIRLVLKIATEVTYRNTLGLNVLTIRI